MRFILNRDTIQTDLPPGLATADFLRQHAGLKGTKIACRTGDCGACTILLGEIRQGSLQYRTANSCLLPLGALQGRHLVTIEGLNLQELTLIQRAILDYGASQCGFCTPGMVVSLTGALLAPGHSDIPLRRSLNGNLCRCTGYASIIRAANALEELGAELRGKSAGERLTALIDHRLLAPWFSDIPARLAAIAEEAGPRAQPGLSLLVGGATDLMVRCPTSLREKPLRFIRRSGEPSVRRTGTTLLIDAATTFAEAGRDDLLCHLLPDLPQWIEEIASPQIRNTATIGGNLVNASPIADMAILLLAIGAELKLVRPDGERWLPLAHFYLGYRQTALADDEELQLIRIHAEPKPLVRFEKVCRRRHLDIASVNCALGLQLEGGRIAQARISAGGVAPIPLLLRQASAAILGLPPTRETARLAIARAATEIAPISDTRGSAAYKTRLLCHLIEALLSFNGVDHGGGA